MATLEDNLEAARAERAAMAAEYGTYVAAVPIFIGGTRAFNPGDPVPVSHVTRGVVAEADVARTDPPASPANAASGGKES